MALNTDSLTLGEVATVEKLSGLAFSQIADDEAPKGLALAALAFVAKRREDSTFTWNAAQELTMADLDGLIDLGGDEEEDQVETTKETLGLETTNAPKGGTKTTSKSARKTSPGSSSTSE